MCFVVILKAFAHILRFHVQLIIMKLVTLINNVLVDDRLPQGTDWGRSEGQYFDYASQ